MLPGTRKAVAYCEQHPDVKAIASADASAAGLVVYNYNFRFNWPSDNTDLTAAQAVTPAFANLSFSGPVTVDRYLVDRETSNIARYLDAGEAPDHHGTMLARVETCTATVSGGTLALPARVLGPSAVSLWIVRSGGGDSAPCR
jgi:hypothetical protein